MVFDTFGFIGRGFGVSMLACSLVLSGGCDDSGALDDELAADDQDDESQREGYDGEAAEEPRGAVNNGFQLNGFQLNGFQLNGFQLNGFQLNGVEDSANAIAITDIDLPMGNGSVVDSWLDGGDLHLQTDGGEVLSGADLEGVKIKYDVTETNKKGKTVRINSVTPAAPGSDVLFYDIDLKLETGPWKPLCLDSMGSPTEALLIGRVWSGVTGAPVHEGVADRVTFACRDAALAKCVEFGYRPWAEAGGVSLEDLHQACTRMVRADYCGDSVSHTVNGTGIHILDQAGIQVADPNVSYVVEAEWGPDGATCLNVANTRIEGENAGCQLPACGSDFSSGGLLQSGKITGP